MKNRRHFLLGAVTSALGTSLIANQANAQMDPQSYTPDFFLNSCDDLQTLLDDGNRFFILDPNQEYEFSNIVIPSGVTIIGNGSTVRAATADAPVFRISQNVHQIYIQGINFDGNLKGTPYGRDVVKTHIGIEVYKASYVTIENCGFEDFLGAGISMFNHNGNKLAVDLRVSGCRFSRCQYGWIAWYNCEYGILSDNHFTNCRVGMWNCSGNWLVSGNVAVDCRAAYISTPKPNEIAFSTGGNFAHGTITGNTMNHSNDSPWPATPLKFGNATRAFQGVVFDSVLPVTFTGNSMWYTDFSAENLLDEFYLTGCTLSNCLVTASGKHAMHLTGCWVRSSVHFNGDINLN